MLTLSSTSRIFVFTGVTDMRKSFNGLSGLVATHFDVELLSGHLFLFFNHLPLYRLEDVFARAGVVISRSTQVDLLSAAADLLRPLIDTIKTRLLQSDVLGMDDTPVRLQDVSLPGKMRTARMWLARGRGRDAAPYNVFFFHESASGMAPQSFSLITVAGSRSMRTESTTVFIWEVAIAFLLRVR